MKINNKEYKIPELDFNAMCTLEDMGVNINAMDEKIFSTIRGFIAITMNTNLDDAGKQLEAFLSDGGSIEDVMNEINEAVENSGFFQSLSQAATKKTSKKKEKKAQKKS